MFPLVEWILEGLFGVINVKSVTSPRKEFENYSIGENVQTKYPRERYTQRKLLRCQVELKQRVEVIQRPVVIGEFCAVTVADGQLELFGTL